jgi:hypothetical protein
MQQWDDLPLEFRLEVNENVATTDQVQFGIRSVADQILYSEGHHLADALSDPIGVGIYPGEEAIESLG